MSAVGVPACHRRMEENTNRLDRPLLGLPGRSRGHRRTRIHARGKEARSYGEAGEAMTTRPKRPPNKRQFTELFVRKLKPKATAFVVWDLHQRGLAIRVQPTGRKTWKCIYARHGRTRWLHLGGADAIGLADARTLAAEAMLAVARGKDPAAEKKAERGAGTFAELAVKAAVTSGVSLWR